MWILVIIFSLLFAVCVLSNVAVWLAFLFRKKTGSTVPILGAAAGMAAVLLAPVDGARQFWWAPWLVDPGGLLWCLCLLRGFFASSAKTRLNP